ncbi:hypothetical protein Rrhod_0186 [Rhodococcus rhodnii LMG 5362]|uniref:Large ribosomal subunit protein bL36 n=1 Tax=Rhodococcus rhodnii LMG 5362 TaxID=1273125 RepID=R7WSZ0_9NOCA|nr:hypothetical protein Rrhod_0186 [Rhodococcus rhodnii LMG 5362]
MSHTRPCSCAEASRALAKRIRSERKGWAAFALGSGGAGARGGAHRAPVMATIIITVLLCRAENTGGPVKVRASLKSLAAQPGAQVVRRRGRIFVINKKNPRFKGRQK